MSEQTVLGRTAIVTGGASGIGFAVAKSLARAGAHVFIAGRTGDPLIAAEERLSGLEGKVRAIQTDVSVEEDVADLAFAVSSTGRVADILVNAAGVCHMGLLGECEPQLWDEMMDTNVRGTYLCCRAFAPGMIERRSGSIVNFSSIVAGYPVPQVAGYAATKAAVAAYSTALAKELSQHNVRVHVVQATLIDTPMRRKVDDSPPEQWIQPDDVAQTVMFMLTRPENVFIESVRMLPLGRYNF